MYHKAVVLLRKRADMSREDFIAYYEQRHVPLVRRIFPMIGEYRRNFIDRQSAALGPIAPAADADGPYFDVITEIWFEDDAQLRTFVDMHKSADEMALLQADEENFLDRSMMQIFLVDEYVAARAQAA